MTSRYEELQRATQERAPLPVLTVVSESHRSAKVWYNGVELKNLIAVDVRLRYNEPAEVTVTFQNVSVNYYDDAPQKGVLHAGQG